MVSVPSSSDVTTALPDSRASARPPSPSHNCTTTRCRSWQVMLEQFVPPDHHGLARRIRICGRKIVDDDPLAMKTGGDNCLAANSLLREKLAELPQELFGSRGHEDDLVPFVREALDDPNVLGDRLKSVAPV